MFDGNKIRQIRTERGYSLKKVSEKSNVSTSMISKIERNEVDPTVTTLYKICNGLDISLTDLLRRDDSESIIIRKSERKTIKFPASNSKYEFLTPVNKGNIDMMMIYLDPGQIETDTVFHSGEESGLILKGSLTVLLGDNEHILHEGDSISFNSEIPHRFINDTNETSVSVWAMVKR